MNDKIQIKEPLSAALYARVSTQKQENEATVESQIAEIKLKIEEDGNVLTHENIFIDDGWSGEMIQRPALDLMRDAADENKFQALYVYDRGRLSRIYAHQEIVLEEIRDKGIQFISLHDTKAETPEERVLQAMQGVFHEYERIKIAERMRRGKLYKARNGVIINGQALYGYNLVRKGDKDIATYEINEDEAKAVRLIWNWFGNERLSINEIKKRLYDLGIKPKKRKSDFWTKGPIIRVLKQETYVTGVAYYNKSEAIVARNPMKDERYKKVKKTSRRVRERKDWIDFAVPKIIEDLALYEKIQGILDFNQKYSHKKKKYDYLLTGLVHCGCGNKRSGDGSSKYGHFYYRCTERIHTRPFESRCKIAGVNAAILDAMLWRELRKHLNDYSLIKKYAEKWVKSLMIVGNDDQNERRRLSDLIIKLSDEQTRYAKAYGAGTLEFEQFQELVKDIKKRKVAYQAQLKELDSKVIELKVQVEVDDLVAEAIKVIENLDFSDKIKVVRDIIGKVIVTERSGIEVWAHLPINITTAEKLGYGTERWNRRSSKRR